MWGITSDEYDKLIKKFKEEECKLLEDMQDHSKADEAFLLTSSYLLDLASRAHELFMSSQPAQKNVLLKFVLANCKADGEKLCLQLKSTFEGIVFANKSNQWLPLVDKFRTLNWGVIKENELMIFQFRKQLLAC